MTVQEVFSFLEIEITTDKTIIREAYLDKLSRDTVIFGETAETFIKKLYEAAVFYADHHMQTGESGEISLKDYALTPEDFEIWDARQERCFKHGRWRDVGYVFRQIQPLFPKEPAIYERTARVFLLDGIEDESVSDLVWKAEENGIGSDRITILQLRRMRLQPESGAEEPSGETAQQETEQQEAEPAFPETLEEALCLAQVLLLEWQEEEKDGEILSGLMAETALICMRLERFGEALEYILEALERMMLPAYASDYALIEVEEQRKKKCLSGFYNVKNMTGVYDLSASYCMSLGRFYSAVNRPKEALQYYEKVFEKYPQNGTLGGTIGTLYFQRMQKTDSAWVREEALSYLTRQIEKSFVKAPFYLVRSKLYLWQKAYKQAQADVDAVITNKKETKLLPEALLLKAKILLAEHPDERQKAGYYMEKAYAQSVRIMDGLSADRWLDRIRTKLEKECAENVFGYWRILLEGITEVFHDILLYSQIVEFGETCCQREGDIQQEHLWQERRSQFLAASGEICREMDRKMGSELEETALCSKQLLAKAPYYALHCMKPEEQTVLMRLMR